MTQHRIRRADCQNRITSAADAAELFKNGMIVATSGFTPSGYPKAVPLALADRVRSNEHLELTLICGASVGEELDGILAQCGAMTRRYAYQTNNTLRNKINSGIIHFQDMHLSHVPQYLDYGFLGDVDIALIEALAITGDGGIVPTTSVGLAPEAIQNASQVIVEINLRQPLALEGMHDIYMPKKPPFRQPIPLTTVSDKIGLPYMPCDPDKIAAIVLTDMPDRVRPLGPLDETSRKISGHIIELLEHEVKKGRLPHNLLPLQSGVGSVANAVLGGLINSKFENLTCYTEVIQDAMLDLIDSGKVLMASGTSITPSEAGLKRFFNNLEHYRKHCILRPMVISNNPELIRRLGVIAMNTALEVDIYGHVNSTNVMGSTMMNGIGGSGDFTRNAYLSIFTTPSIAKGGLISSIVPMVAHVDHTEHDVDIIVTEQGIADLRGTSPVERARRIIANCAHPDYRALLQDYLDQALKTNARYQPHLLTEALTFHTRYLSTGTMKA